jgi:flagellar biosynthesis/type III secretory pathway chaperone
MSEAKDKLRSELEQLERRLQELQNEKKRTAKEYNSDIKEVKDTIFDVLLDLERLNTTNE